MKTNVINLIKKSTVISVIAVMIAGCSSPEEQTEQGSLIQPPFSELIPEFDEYTIDATEGDTIVKNSGTSIIIPPGALVDDSGNVVTGKVNIKYREYHDALDIFLSGIPMDFTSNGQTMQMQTAGMFEIRAEQEGRELQLAENKKMEIVFASYEPGADYNFFAYDEADDKWKFVDYAKPVENPEREVIRKKIAELEPDIIVPFGKDYFVLNYNAFIDVYFNDDWAKIYKNKDSATLKNKARKYGLRMFDLYGGSVSVKGNTYPAGMMVWKNLSGHNFPRWTKGYYCDVKSVGGNVFLLSVSDKKIKKTTTLKAECIMPLKYLFRFTPEQWQSDYDATMRKIAIEERRLQLEAEVFRAIKISGFGIYNYDKLMKLNNPVQVAAVFKLDEQVENQAYALDMVYCLPGDNRTVIKLPVCDWDNLCIDPNDKNFRLFTILPGNRIALFPVSKYRSINFGLLKRLERPLYTFVLETQDGTIKSKADMEKILNI
ncbi:MAG: hypothetical protein ABII90_12390 [Bacteroidota bacterium]